VLLKGWRLKRLLVYDWEKKEFQQDLLFDLEMEHDKSSACRDDDLLKTLNEAISNFILSVIAERQFGTHWNLGRAFSRDFDRAVKTECVTFDFA